MDSRLSAATPLLRRIQQRLISTSITARWLGVDPRTVRLWAECGELPALKAGRQWRFDEAAVLDWLSRAQRQRLGSGLDRPAAAPGQKNSPGGVDPLRVHESQDAHTGALDTDGL